MNLRARTARTALLPVLVCALAASANGQPTADPAPGPGSAPPATVHRPAAAGRVVHRFDFEERADPDTPGFNPEAVPRHWVRAQHNPPARDRPGFPLGNKAGYDVGVGHDSKVSVVLPTAGGSTALRLSGTFLPVFPGIEYEVSALVRTAGLTHARAVLTAALLDVQARPIPGASARSEPIAPDDWTMVRVSLPAAATGAAFVEIELLLLQPEQFEASPTTAPFHVWPVDLEGAAWFDDVAVVQLPRATLTTSTPAGIAAGPIPPTFSATIRDFTGEHITARLTLHDAHGDVVQTLDRPLGPGGGDLDWAPLLPGFGWYQATLQVLAEGRPLGEVISRVVWLPAPSDLSSDQARAARSRFALDVGATPVAAYDLLPRAVRESGCGAVTLTLGPAGDADLAAAPAVADLRRLLDPLLADRHTITLRWSQISAPVARALRLDPDDPLTLFEQDPTVWMPLLHPLLDAFGQRVQRWSLGSPEASASLRQPDLARRLAGFRSVLARAVPGPVVVLPWHASWTWPAAASGDDSAVGEVVVHVPAAMPTADLPGLADAWAARAATRTALTVLLHTPPSDAQARSARAADLAVRAAILWELLDPWRNAALPPVRLGLVQPWTSGEPSSGALLPDETLAAWRTLADRLGPRRAAGRLPTPPGMTALMLVDAQARADGRRTAAILTWSDPLAESDLELVTHLGDGPITVVDIFGNVAPLAPVNTGGQYRLRAHPSPTFVEGVDAELAMFVQAVRLHPDMVPATPDEKDAVLTVYNPWPVRIAGTIQLAPPAGSPVPRSWRFTPTAPLAFALEPGEHARLPVAFTFSPAEESGRQDLTAIVRLTAGPRTSPLVLTTPITIGVAGLEFHAAVVPTPTPAGPDLVATARVVNTSSRPRTLQVEAIVPGLSLQQQPISELAPGGTAVRRFLFKGAAAALSGKRVRLTVTDADGVERLNKSVRVP